MGGSLEEAVRRCQRPGLGRAPGLQPCWEGVLTHLPSTGDPQDSGQTHHEPWDWGSQNPRVLGERNLQAQDRVFHILQVSTPLCPRP